MQLIKTNYNYVKRYYSKLFQIDENKFTNSTFCIKKILYKKCFNANCRVGKFSINYHYSYLYNLFLSFQNKSFCYFNGFNYILICNKCKCYYISESFRTVKERISEHLNDTVKVSFLARDREFFVPFRAVP